MTQLVLLQLPSPPPHQLAVAGGGTLGDDGASAAIGSARSTRELGTAAGTLFRSRQEQVWRAPVPTRAPPRFFGLCAFDCCSWAGLREIALVHDILIFFAGPGTQEIVHVYFKRYEHRRGADFVFARKKLVLVSSRSLIAYRYRTHVRRGGVRPTRSSTYL